jgi:hypothetical protein
MAQKSIKSYSSIRYPKYWMRAKIFRSSDIACCRTLLHIGKPVHARVGNARILPARMLCLARDTPGRSGASIV